LKRAVVVAGVTSVALAVGVGAAVAGTAPQAGEQQVSYLGMHFAVPADWSVVHVSADSTTCVRFDRHAVYLGTPGARQDCPAGVVGRTEALLVQPATTPASTTTATEDTTSHDITVAGPTVSITATYDTDRAALTRVLASAGLPAPVAQRPLAAGAIRARATAAALPTDATNFTGIGFDACEAPNTTVMNGWKTNSPYSAIGIYIGGPRRTCSQPNLTAAWMSTEAAAGWHFLPMYAGPQAVNDTDITDPQAQGAAAADDAATQAAALGLGAGNVLYYNMENYSPSARGKALALLAAWTTELHKDGYLSGVYGSANSGTTDLVANYGGSTTPDVDFNANWNDVATTDDTRITAGEWADHQRVHQYGAPNDETYGGYKIQVDTDAVDVGVAGSTPNVAGSGFHSTSPVRVLDTRNGIGVAAGAIGPNGTTALQVTGANAVPTNVTAVVLNVTATASTTGGYVSVFPDGVPVPNASNLNFTTGETIANLVTVPVIDGAVDFHNSSGSVQVLADLFGYYTSAGGQSYAGTTPTRALDTRNGTGAPKAKLGARQSLTLNVAGVGSVPSTVSSVILNVTATNSTTGGYLTVYPSSAQSVPTASNVNFSKGETIANLVIVPVTNGSVKIFNLTGTVDVVADVVGYFTAGPSNSFTPTSPTRLLDTRNGIGSVTAPIGAGQVRQLSVVGKAGIPAGVTGVVLNVTATKPTSGGYLTVYPDGPAGRPTASSLNFSAGQTIPNLVVVPVTDGLVDFYNFAGDVDVLADLAGYYVG
jgi:hypothetical protein